MVRLSVRALIVAGCVALANPAVSADKPLVTKAPPATPASPFQNFPCNFGGMLGGALSLQNSVNSTSAFYRGNSNSYVAPYVGALVDCELVTYGNGPDPFGTWTFSTGLTLDLSLGTIPFSGTGGGVPVTSTGHLTQLDTFWLLKLTTPLNHRYNFSLFGGPGIATLWPRGQPTGPGGPSITGTDTAFALRTGIELSQVLYAGWRIALDLIYQYTAPTKYSTTLPGEEFRFKGSNRVMLGLSVQTVDFTPPPPPPGTSTVEQLTPQLTTPPSNYTPATTPGSVCGPDITDAVLAVLRKIREDYNTGGFSQADACENLTNIMTGSTAWDIIDLGPEIGDPPTWFTPYVANQCAIPRPQCQASVEFLGTCQHAQTVNYVMWGMLGSLCKIPNAYAYLQARNMLTGRAAQTDIQLVMTAFGRGYARELDRTSPADDKPPPPPDISKLKKWFMSKVRKMPPNDAVPEAQCALHCPIKAKLPVFRYRWQGMNWEGPKDDE